MTPTGVLYFATPADWRRWLARNHRKSKVLWVGFHRKESGTPSITWPESVDQALCFGWIDGIRKSIDAGSYTIRFTPRRPGSLWSAVNLARFAELARLGLVKPAGRAAFEARDDARSRTRSQERAAATLDAAARKTFQANARAWSFFSAQPPGYRKLAAWYVVSAKKPETRQKRLAILIDDSAHGRRLAGLARDIDEITGIRTELEGMRREVRRKGAVARNVPQPLAAARAERRRLTRRLERAARLRARLDATKGLQPAADIERPGAKVLAIESGRSCLLSAEARGSLAGQHGSAASTWGRRASRDSAISTLPSTGSAPKRKADLR